MTKKKSIKRSQKEWARILSTFMDLLWLSNHQLIQFWLQDLWHTLLTNQSVLFTWTKVEVVSWFVAVSTCTMTITLNLNKIRKLWTLLSNSFWLMKYNLSSQKMIMKILSIITSLILLKSQIIWRVVSTKDKKFLKILQQCLSANFSSMISSMYLKLSPYLRKCKWNMNLWHWLFLNLKPHCWD